MKRILFLCTGNSARSQMAEGLINGRFGDAYTAFSAGLEPSRVNPRAIRTMEEIGLDISGQLSKHVDEFEDEKFDAVITLCADARDNCPVYIGEASKYHLGFEDPAAATGSKEERLETFRAVRDDIIK
ncbi:arsenate reductase ArsC, partial [candidate division KSB1 bacterium]